MSYHALVGYVSARHLWRLSHLGDNHCLAGNLLQWWNAMNGLFNVENMGVTATVVWAIWNRRNNLIWNAKKSNEAATLGSVVGTLQ